MGLDQYLMAEKEGADSVEIAYWRKHPDLHGMMEKIWLSKGKPGDGGDGSFNCIPLFLDEADISVVEEAIKEQKLPHTMGFFFGKSIISEDQAKEDLDVLAQARAYIHRGYAVYYDSWW
jgi:hypothetical protein